jgi:ketosteroid isomerase-like protein
MRTLTTLFGLTLTCVLTGCANASRPAAADANAGIDSLNARITDAYRTHAPQAYAMLYTDNAVFEWPAFNTVHGRAGMSAMARDNWQALKDMDLKLTVASRRIDGDHATEFGSFEQSWRDSSGARMAEFGRYVSVLALQGDGRWLMDHFFGFEDSTRTLAPR